MKTSQTPSNSPLSSGEQDILQFADFDKGNDLLPTIIQDERTKQVLMLGYMNQESLQKTLETGKVWFYSRSKKRLWMKGETSGNVLELVNVKLDCDNDTVLIKANPKGPTCHTGQTSCFGEEEGNVQFLQYLFELIAQRKKELPKGSYTTSLFQEGLDRIVQKVGEEATEVVIAAKNGGKQRVVEETADLFFHVLVMLMEKGVRLEEVMEELQKRHQ